MRLHNNKVRLIGLEPAHWVHIYGWSNSGEYNYFFGNLPPLTSELASKFNSRGVNLLIVNPKNIDEVYGLVSISNIQERNRNVHYNILIDKKCQGQDIAKEASKLAIYYIMNCLNMYKVIAEVNEDNDVSKTLTESFGFEFEAKLKQEVYIDGEFKDVIRYRLTKGPFNKSYKSVVELGE